MTENKNIPPGMPPELVNTVHQVAPPPPDQPGLDQRNTKPRIGSEPPEASKTAKSEVEPSTVLPVSSSDEAGRPASASSIAPTRKVLAAGAGGGGIGVPLSVILAYHLPEMPTEVAVAYSGLLVAFLSFAAGYLVPPER
jgi:uncharacterized membrane protein YfcA